MQIDFTKHDGYIVLAASPRQGTWVSSTLVNGSRNIRCAGRLPESTAHHLLTIGLISACRAVTRKMVDNITNGRPTARKFRLKILCEDADFINSLRSLVKSQRLVKPLRTGRNLFKELARQMARFDVTFATVGEDSEQGLDVEILKQWATDKIPDPTTLANVPSVFLPSVFSTVN